MVNNKEEINVLWIKNIFLAEISNLPVIPCPTNKKQNQNKELENLWAKAVKQRKIT